MGTLRSSLPSTEVTQLRLVRKGMEPHPANLADDGLGCMRGFVIVVLCNVCFVLMGVTAWCVWHLLRK